MSCSEPLSWDALVAYFAGDLPSSDEDRLEEHLMGCEACSREAARVSAVIEALKAVIPPVVTRGALTVLRSRGVVIEENSFAPGVRRTATFRRGTAVLVHRLAGMDLSDAERVDVVIRERNTGEVLAEVPHAPFDVAEGVLIACQRHYEAMPWDTVFEVRATDASGNESVGVYPIPHVFQ